MPRLHLTDIERQDLDGQFAALSCRIEQEEPPTDVLEHAGRIIASMTEKLLRGSARDTWHAFGYVAWGWFGDVEHDATAKALHVVFTMMFRLVEDSSTPYRLEKHVGQLDEALADYLDVRRPVVE